MRVLFVSGNWDDEGGKPSGYMGKLSKMLQLGYYDNVYFDAYAEFNGGKWEDLRNKILSKVMDYGIIFWLTHSPSDKPKLIELVKKINPKAILVMLSRNDNGESSIYIQAAKMLKAKANLMLQINKQNELFHASVLDPLGNCFLDKEENIEITSKVLTNRISFLRSLTRVPSVSIGNALEIPDEVDFFQIARKNAERFHDLIHGDNTSRFMGNLSFRCENGFPSFKKNGFIYVSERNIDKRSIGKEGFVAINPYSKDLVQYYGDKKPSVDTPVQLRMYDYYSKIKYIMHSHVYIKDKETHGCVYPCGVIEESTSFFRRFPDQLSENIAANLAGHGSIVLSSNLEFLKSVEYVERDLPNMQTKYATMLKEYMRPIRR